MMNQNQATPEVKPWNDPEIVHAVSVVFKEFYNEDEAVLDRKNMIADAINSTGEQKDFGFSLLIGFCKAGMVSISQLTLALTRINGSEKERAPVLVAAYLEHEPADADAVTLMEQLKTSYPELLADVIIAKKSWKTKDIRAGIKSYMLTKALWLQLQKHLEQKGAAEKQNMAAATASPEPQTGS